MKKEYLIVIAAVVIVLLVGVAFLSFMRQPAPTPPPKEEEKPKLIIYHWWTAGGEKEAIDAVISLYKEKYPEIEIVENPVPGGAGVTMKAVMKALMVAGSPPDTFQVHAGAELKEYVDSGLLRDVTDLWKKNGYDKVFPEGMKKMVTINGKVYSIPINIHRSNWLWYNKKIFDELGLEPPKTLDELLEVCKKIKEAGYWPIALGSRNKWPVTHMFENLLLAVGGPETYVKFFIGQITADDPKVKATLEYMKKLMPYIYPYHADLTWDQACGLLVQKKAAMTIMGDWALGYFIANGLEPEVDFGAVPVPGTDDYFVLLSDSFAIPKDAKHLDAAEKWVVLVGTKEAQEKFNLIKGSIAARTDVSPDIYPDPIRKQCAKDLVTKIIVPSATHGGISPDSFMSNLHNILDGFLYTGDVDATVKQINQAIKLTNLADFWKGYTVEDFIGRP